MGVVEWTLHGCIVGVSMSERISNALVQYVFQ